MNDFDLMNKKIQVSYVIDKAIVLNDDPESGLKPLSRTQLMAKLARSDDLKIREVQIEHSPSVCILLKNMFDPAEETEPGWEKEVENEIKGECQKYGEIVHIAVDVVIFLF
jgi:RNA-binding protein 39